MQLDLEPPFLVIKPGVSEDEFYRLGEDSDWEYLGGRLVMSPASDRHEYLSSFLNALVLCYLDERGGAVVRGSRYPMRLDSQWSPEPDLMVVRDEHRHRMNRRWLEGPADLVVEIASDGDPGFDKREKLPRYREAGVPEIWMIDPAAETVLAETRQPGGYNAVTLASGRLASTVLPGFWLDVAWLWQEKLPPVAACLRQILGR
jgi:Uma2 family endonuclease